MTSKLLHLISEENVDNNKLVLFTDILELDVE